MPKTFSLILPTKDRPYLLEKLFESLAKTTFAPEESEIVLCIDQGDAIDKNVPSGFDCRELIIPANASGMGHIYRKCYNENEAKYMLLLNDDIIVRTKNWDTKILDAFADYPDDLVLVYPNDLYYGPKLSCFPIISRTVAGLMGGICPDEYKRHAIDSHIYDIFVRLAKLGFNRLKYLPRVIFEHMHFGVTAASYENSGSDQDNSRDIELFHSLAEQRNIIASNMADYIKSVSSV